MGNYSQVYYDWDPALILRKVHTRSQAEGTKEDPIDLSSLRSRKRSLSVEPPSRNVRQKSLGAAPGAAVAAPAAMGLVAYYSKDTFHELFKGEIPEVSEKDALAAFEHVEADGNIPSTQRAKVWLKGALSFEFENLAEKIVTSDIIKDSTLQGILKFVASKSAKVFEILLVRENARGLGDQVRFATNVSCCLHVVCTYDRPHALISSMLSIIEKAWSTHHDGTSEAIFNVRDELMTACSEEKTLLVLQLIDVSFWVRLRASYVLGTPSLRKKLDALKLSDELMTRLNDLIF